MRPRQGPPCCHWYGNVCKRDSGTWKERDIESTNVGRCCCVIGSHVHETVHKVLSRAQDIYFTFFGMSSLNILVSPQKICWFNDIFLGKLTTSKLYCNTYTNVLADCYPNLLGQSLLIFSYKHLVDGFLQETSPLSCQKKWRQKERERKRYLWPFDAARRRS